MRIQIKNLGPIAIGEFELADLTIICGQNNMGKTYATYGLFGFLAYWNEVFQIPVKVELYREIYTNGSVTVDLAPFIKQRNDILKLASDQYLEVLPSVFASNEKHFQDSEFLLELETPTNCPLPGYARSLGAAKTQTSTC